jgi:phosphatidylserine/phosphatidylglycerophosphate/cardiolipin synthase-like enzyme
VRTFADGKIKAYCGPRELEAPGHPDVPSAPDDIAKTIVEFVSEATETLDIAVQEIDSHPIAEAVIAKKRQGVTVRILLNRSYLEEDSRHKPSPSLTTIPALVADERGEYKVNRDIFAALQRCGVEMRIDLNPDDRIFHHKFVLRDVRLNRDGKPERGRKPGLLTGSANFTDTDCHMNLNNLFVFRHAGLEKDFAEEFREAWAGEFGRGRLGKPPNTHNLGGVPVKVLFAPDHGPESEVIKQMLKCPKGGTIDFAMFTFTGSSAIDDAMAVLAGADRTVRGIIDRRQGREDWAASRWLQESGVDVRVPIQQGKSGIRKLHHKLAVIDGSTVVGGSFNYSEPATLYNDEALLVLGSPYKKSEGVTVKQGECRALAQFFTKEIERIRELSEEWPGQD